MKKKDKNFFKRALSKMRQERRKNNKEQMKTTTNNKKTNSKVVDLNTNRQEITLNMDEGDTPRKFYDRPVN